MAFFPGLTFNTPAPSGLKFNAKQTPTNISKAVQSGGLRMDSPTQPKTATQTPAYRSTAPAPQGVGDITPAFDQDAAQRNMFDQINSAYGDVYNNLNNQESQLRGGEQNLYDSFTGQFDAQKPLLQSAYNSGVQMNTQQQEKENLGKENALTSARRMFQDVGQGVKQRFGGGNSTSEFANAFYGREFQRNVGNVINSSGENMRKLLDKSTQIKSDYDAQLSSLEQQKQSALLQAKDVFSQRLAAINNARLGADQNKAQLKLEALQEMRNTIASVQQQALATQQQLQTSIAQAQSQMAAQVQSYRTQAGQSVDTNAIANPFYSQFGKSLQNIPQLDLNKVYGQYRRDDERA